jgi:predicted nucleic acid-binding protein
MDQLKDSSAWLAYFERNRLNRPEPDWDRPSPFPPEVAARLARSLAHFQLGESCEGNTLLAGVRGRWPDDPDYIAAMALFVAEEREHARLLEHLVRRLGGTLVTSHWTDRCFTLARHALGVGFEIQAVMVAELVGGAYFRLLRSTGDAVLRQVCELMVRDEDQHRRFHVDRVVVAQLGWSRLRRALWVTQFELMFGAAVLAAWIDHRSALRAVGIDRRLFLGEARRDAAAWIASTADARPALRRLDHPPCRRPSRTGSGRR